ncbi:hypothetical protein PIB30_084579 [Stylosanthes scabra]|uniref:Retrotransposon gag domain-containing protein n=1 Tax=Stylosanthes scabra TaxID=79078 RepID=A0ABU6SUT0_9FABA|nr:hypothetical protein [Stylosanthes scabra]
MLLVNASDAIQCKAFTITLKKEALTWFNALPPGSIEQLHEELTTHRKLPKTCLNLYSIVQKPEKTLRSYLDRFNTECTQIEGRQSQAALMALVKGLKEDTLFLKSLTKKPPKTMEEIQERSNDYLQQEEGQTAVKTDRNKKDNPPKRALQGRQRTERAQI